LNYKYLDYLVFDPLKEDNSISISDASDQLSPTLSLKSKAKSQFTLTISIWSKLRFSSLEDRISIHLTQPMMICDIEN
jgi:hypothetical protein